MPVLIARSRWRAALLFLLGLAVLSLALQVARTWRHRQAVAAGLERRLTDIVMAPAAAIIPCSDISSADTPVVLAMGQSSGGNHGLADLPHPAPIPMASLQGCLWARESLQGATGRGGSVWSRLPAELALRKALPPVLMSELAVESSSIAEWTRQDNSLRVLLLQHLDQMKMLGRLPTLILWNQGAADVRDGMSMEDYRAGLLALTASVQSQVGPVRMLLAPTARCRSEASTEFYKVVAHLVAMDSRFANSHLLDLALSADMRYGDCHLNVAGLSRAATLGADAAHSALLSTAERRRGPP